MKISISSTVLVVGSLLVLPALSAADLDARSYELAAQELASRALDELSAREGLQGLVDLDERDHDSQLYRRDLVDREDLENLLERAYLADLAERDFVSDTTPSQFEKRSKAPESPNFGHAIYRRDPLDGDFESGEELLERHLAHLYTGAETTSGDGDPTSPTPYSAPVKAESSSDWCTGKKSMIWSLICATPTGPQRTGSDAPL